MHRALLALVLGLALGSPLFQWVAGPNGAPAEAGNGWDPNGATAEAGGQWDPNG